MTQTDLQELFARPERSYPAILSVYLLIDPSQRDNRNRGFVRQLETMLSGIRSTIHEAPEIERFGTAAHHVQDFVSACQSAGPGLALFFDAADGFFRQEELGVPVHNQARWDRELFLQPLANILDQFEPLGVALFDASHLRLFTISLNKIEEVGHEPFGPVTRLRRVVEKIDSLLQTHRIRRLVLAGAPELISGLRRRLPKRLSTVVIGTAALDIQVPAAEVLKATRPIQAEFERSTETQTVREVLHSLRNQKTVTGMGRTLKALNSDRVWELIYSEGLSASGFECTNCTALFSVPKDYCSYCGSPVRTIANVVERAVGHAVRKGAKIELVTGKPSTLLNTVGGIAAFLKATHVVTAASARREIL